jgi:hypothetical protein
VMSELDYGPNGGVVYCFEWVSGESHIKLLFAAWDNFCCRYLMQNMDWLEEELGGYEDEYLIFDCPG